MFCASRTRWAGAFPRFEQRLRACHRAEQQVQPPPRRFALKNKLLLARCVSVAGGQSGPAAAAAPGHSPIAAPSGVAEGAPAVILNVSTYRFAPVPDTAALRDAVLERARAAQLKGTVLIAEEGLNLALAGPVQPLRALLDWLQESDERFAGLPVKESFSASMPFRKLKVKVKREIITMNPQLDQHQHPLLPAATTGTAAIPAASAAAAVVRPAAGRAPAVSARTLARWLAQGRRDDEGRPVVLLDTRNAFEVDAGHFEGAVDWRLRKFSDFPRALEAALAQEDPVHLLRGKTVVTYCTGGIRCEKAALVMLATMASSSPTSTASSSSPSSPPQPSSCEDEQADEKDEAAAASLALVTRVHQLDGGILRYLEEFAGTGGPAPGWLGDCVVFDDRVALHCDLTPAAAAAAAAAAPR
jgi:UPF0176 protein